MEIVTEELFVSLSGDAAYFTKDELLAAGEELQPLGQVSTQQLFQFSDVSSCRIVIDIYQQTVPTGLVSYAVSGGIGVVSGLIANGVSKLLSNARSRRAIEGGAQPPDEPTKVEVVERTWPDGAATRTLSVTSTDDEVISRAIRAMSEAMKGSSGPLSWNSDSDQWIGDASEEDSST